MIKFTISSRPKIDKFRKKIEKKIKKISNLTPVYKKISIYLDRWTKLNFRTEGGKVGGWKKFKHGGRLNYEGVGTHVEIYTGSRVVDAWADTSAKLLQDTGRLRASVLPFSSDRDAGIGSDLPYSKAHDKGKGVPKRQIIPVDSDVTEQILEIVDNHVKKIAND